MNRRFCVIFLFGFLAVFSFICINGVHSQGQCLNGGVPFSSKVGPSFCSMYTEYGCCAEKENAELSIRFNRLANNVPSHIWRNCSSYAKNLLCQSCSPYAAYLHGAVTDDALKRIPRKFPRLCKDFCTKFHNDCKDIVKYYTEEIEDKKTPPNERQNLLDASEESLDAFCKLVELHDSKYCFPASTNKTIFKTGLVNKPDPVTRPNPENRKEFYTEPVIEQGQDSSFFSPPENKTRVKKRAADDVDCLCVEKIASKLRMPLFLKNANDGSNRLFIGEQIGIIHIYYPDGTKLKKPFLDITSRIKKMTSIEQGMTGMAFHPNFKSNGYFYVYFSTPKGKSKVNHYSNVGEFRVSSTDVNKADPDYFRLLLQIPQPTGVHNGGEMLFGVDYYLYLFLGDGGKRGDPDGNAQNMESLLGKVLRIDVNKRTGDKGYGIPPDNPFQDPLPDGTIPSPEIFSLGLRNPWRCGVDPGDRMTGEGYGRIMCGDVGQSKVEEIDLIEKGANYGWNQKEGNQNYCSDCKLAPVGKLKKPIFHYHRNTRFGKSVIGGQFYRGCMYPNLNGMFLWGDFTSGLLFRLLENEDTGKWENKEIEMCSSCRKPFSDSYEQNIVSFGADENGEVYLLSSQGVSSKKEKGSVYRLVDPSRQEDPESCISDFKELSASSIQQSSTKNKKQPVKETNGSSNDKKGQASTTEEHERQTVNNENEGQTPKQTAEASTDAVPFQVQAVTSSNSSATFSSTGSTTTIPTTSTTSATSSTSITVLKTSSASTTVPSTSSTSTTVPITSSTSTTVPTTSSTSTAIPTTSSTSTTIPTTSSTSTTVPTTSSTSTIVPTTSSTSTIVPTTSNTSTIVPPTGSTSTTVPTTSSTSATVPTTSSTSTTVPTTSNTSTTVPTTSSTSTTVPTTSSTSTTIPTTSSTSATSSTSTIKPTSAETSTNSKSTPQLTTTTSYQTATKQLSNKGTSTTTASPSSAAASTSTTLHYSASITPSILNTISTPASTPSTESHSETGFEGMSSHFHYLLGLLRVAKARAASSSTA